MARQLPFRLLILISLLGLLLVGGAVVLGMPEQAGPDAAALQKMTARFAPVDIGADLSALPDGERRALAVRAYLMSLGIDGARIQTKSLGEEQPKDAGHDENAWGVNRRVEFVVVK